MGGTVDAVTGAGGYLGSVLIRALAACGRPARAVVRVGARPSPDGRTESRVADLLDPEALAVAFHGVETVYHTAGLVTLRPGAKAQLHAVNVRGTRNVIHACRQAGVRRLVYVSSIEALDHTVTNPLTEDAGFRPDRAVFEYGRSKALATLDVLEAGRQGLEAVVLCPTGYIGPEDHRMSAMGRLVVDYVRGRLPVTVRGGFDFVDVRDVAEGAMRAARRGRPGETYILSGRYLEVREIMAALQGRTGVAAPRVELPPRVALAVAGLAERWYALRRVEPRFSRGSVRILSLGLRVSSDKARRELGYVARPFEQTLDDTLAWFAAAGMVPALPARAAPG